MTEYRIVEYTKGVHRWYEVEYFSPVFWNRNRWLIARGNSAPPQALQFFTKQEAIQYADIRFAPLIRKVFTK
jgi:hypothetical protein